MEIEGLLLEGTTQFSALMFLTVVAEALTEVVKRVWDKAPTQLIALFWGVVLALLCGIDIFAAVGCEETIPYVGCIISGILMSRGSNWLHELAEKSFSAAGLKSADK